MKKFQILDTLHNAGFPWNIQDDYWWRQEPAGETWDNDGSVYAYSKVRILHGYDPVKFILRITDTADEMVVNVVTGTGDCGVIFAPFHIIMSMKGVNGVKNKEYKWSMHRKLYDTFGDILRAITTSRGVRCPFNSAAFCQLNASMLRLRDSSDNNTFQRWFTHHYNRTRPSLEDREKSRFIGDDKKQKHLPLTTNQEVPQILTHRMSKYVSPDQWSSDGHMLYSRNSGYGIHVTSLKRHGRYKPRIVPEGVTKTKKILAPKDLPHIAVNQLNSILATIEEFPAADISFATAFKSNNTHVCIDGHALCDGTILHLVPIDPKSSIKQFTGFPCLRCLKQSRFFHEILKSHHDRTKEEN